MNFLQVLTLAVVQGLCELLPVSSSAHVILAERLMGLDPTAPDMTLLLVMLHTGTMFAVILYFRKQWLATYLSRATAWRQTALVVLATAATGVVGLALLKLIPRVLGVQGEAFEIEQLFGQPLLVSGGLAAAGVMIITSGLRERRRPGRGDIAVPSALAIGVVQGLCLPFRGFSRSGSTISAGLLMSVAQDKAEQFSFALAVVLTPAVIVREVHRFVRASASAQLDAGGLLVLAWPSLVGMCLSFVAGLAALKWLSRWLENGHWHWFGIYCLAMSLLVAIGQFAGH